MKKIIAIVVAFAIVGFNGFMLMEGGVAKGQVVRGWEVTLQVTDELAYTCDDDQGILDFTTIAGMTGGTREVSTSCNIETNNQAGWEVRIYADNDGKMVSAEAEEILAYPTTTPATWVFPDTSASYYGYYTSSSKAVGDFGTTALYRNLVASGVGTLVAEDAVETDSNGIEIDFGFKVQIGSTANQPSGDYSSFVTTTASLI